MEELQTRRIIDSDSRTDKLEKYAKWYQRGAFKLDEYIYHLTQLEKNMGFEELANFLITLIEDETLAEEKETRKELIKILVERGI